MTKLNEIYRCNVCGNMVEMVHAGKGTLVCCGEDMELLIAKTQESGMEKHVPIIEKTEEGIIVKVGSINHPMEDKHQIEWIELLADGKVYRKYLKAGENPEALFSIEADSIAVREYCNIHGLWQA